MRIFTNRSIITVGLLGILLCLFVLAIQTLPKAYASKPGERLIMIHDRGVELGMITEGTTIREVLDEANIDLDKNDRVEPGLDEKLVAESYQVNIYRARPILIIDGNVKQLVMSAYQTPKQIAQHADIQLQDEDIAGVEVSDNFASDGASIRMTIDRATPINLTLYGKKETVYTQATTVAGFLGEKDIQLSKNDDMSHEGNNAITAGMRLNIWRNGKQTITVNEPIKFSVDQVQDMNREIGYREIKTPGVNGEKIVTYEIVMQNGKEKSRKVIQSVTTKAAEKQIETVGAKPRVPTNPSENAKLGHKMMLAYGFGEDQWSCLYNLWMRESGWRVDAANPSGAYGIPQALPGNKMGGDWQNDARTQIQWGLGYVKGRYGTPCGAWSAFLSKGWY